MTGTRPRTVEVLCDLSGLDRTFHYLALPGQPLELGTIVRVELHGRRVRGWVVGLDTPVPEGIEPRPIFGVVSLGPPGEVVEICWWAAWRWAGPLRSLLVAASPQRVVRSTPGVPDPPSPYHASVPDPPSPYHAGVPGVVGEAVRAAIAAGDAVLRVPPGIERLLVVEAALADGAPVRPGADPLVLCESRADVERLARRLRRSGWPVAVHPDEWGRPGCVAIGTRNAAFSPLRPSLTLVLDAHSESYRSERVPSFDARGIAAERARRSGSPIVFVTPCPSLELLAGEGGGVVRRLVTLPPSIETEGWGSVAVLDARAEDPAERGYPSVLVGWIRQAVANDPARPVVCVLDRVGRARLLRCALCGEISRCASCGAAQVLLERPPKGETGVLTCPRCGAAAPAICTGCGSARLQIVRAGVARAREQLEAVSGLAVGEVSGRGGARGEMAEAPVLIGTQAVLHRVSSASLVVFLDFDQELLAPRYLAAEEALSLIARSVRLAGGRRRGGRVVVRTSLPDHEVVRAAVLGDPGLVEQAERERRKVLSLPPYSALARVDGSGAGELVRRLGGEITVSAVGEDRYVVRALRSAVLAEAFAALAAERVGGFAELDARIEMDPIDL